MSRTWIFGLLAAAAAWLLLSRYSSTHAVVPADEAAEKLRRAWADHHTVA